MNKFDPTDYIGETYEDKDRRTTDRRIRVTDYEGGKFRAVVIAAPGFPHTVGRKTNVSQATLDDRYWKVSH